MSRLRISVVTAVRNGRATIGDAMRSVAAQTYSDKEHVIQDGASTDGTVAEVERVRGGIVRLESSPDTGVYDAFNKGLRAATGDVIAFLGADDIYESDDVLSRVADVFHDTAAELVSGDAVFVRGDRPDRIVRYYRSSDFAPGRLSKGLIPAHSATFVRRDVFERFGEFDPSYRIAGDFEWFSRVFGRSSPVWALIPAPLVRMRLGGLSTAGPRATWRVTREIYRACRANGIPTSYPRLMSRFPGKLLQFVRRKAT